MSETLSSQDLFNHWMRDVDDAGIFMSPATARRLIQSCPAPRHPMGERYLANLRDLLDEDEASSAPVHYLPVARSLCA